jgi:hypothetical protein
MTINPTLPQSAYSSSSGTTNTLPFITIFSNVDPTPSDGVNNTPVQTRWLNQPLAKEWILIGFTSNTGVVYSNWELLTNHSAATETLTGNSGGPVPPTGNNINVLGDTTSINIVGTPGTSTLTISTAGTVATSYVENTGSAVPVAGVLNVLGSAGVSTSGTGNTITITAAAEVATTYTENTGTATPALNNLNVLGATGITTTGSGSTITISGATSLPLTFAENTGTAQAVSNVLNVVGSGGITTTGSGNTITITGSGTDTINIQTFTPAGTYTYTPVAGMKYCTVELVGAGGGSGGCATTSGSTCSAGGGGGAGGYCRKTFSAATIGASQTVVIGAGGTAGPAGGTGGAAGTGGTTSFGAFISATGGGGGDTAEDNPPDFPTAEGGGGHGTGGDVNATGGAGMYGWQTLTGVAGGQGGNSYFGGGAPSAVIYIGAIAGNPGTNYGGGGSGACASASQTQQAGAVGADGYVIITEFT